MDLPVCIVRLAQTGTSIKYNPWDTWILKTAHPECTISHHFEMKNSNLLGRGTAPPQTHRRNFRGDGGSGPPTFWRGGRTPSLFATTWFQNITSPKHDVYQRSIVKACKIAVWWVAVRMYISWLPSSQFLHSIAMVQQPQHLLAFSNKCSNIQSALRYRWVTVGANIGIFSSCIIY